MGEMKVGSDILTVRISPFMVNDVSSRDKQGPQPILGRLTNFLAQFPK